MYTGSVIKIQHHYLNWIQQPGQKGTPDRINGHVSESSSDIGYGLTRRGMSSIESTCPSQMNEWIPHRLSTQICGLDRCSVMQLPYSQSHLFRGLIVMMISKWTLLNQFNNKIKSYFVYDHKTKSIFLQVQKSYLLTQSTDRKTMYMINSLNVVFTWSSRSPLVSSVSRVAHRAGN